MKKSVRVLVACLAFVASVSGCSLTAHQVAACAEACAKSGRGMARCSDAECVCDQADGGSR